MDHSNFDSSDNFNREDLIREMTDRNNFNSMLEYPKLISTVFLNTILGAWQATGRIIIQKTIVDTLKRYSFVDQLENTTVAIVDFMYSKEKIISDEVLGDHPESVNLYRLKLLPDWVSHFVGIVGVKDPTFEKDYNNLKQMSIIGLVGEMRDSLGSDEVLKIEKRYRDDLDSEGHDKDSLGSD